MPLSRREMLLGVVAVLAGLGVLVLVLPPAGPPQSGPGPHAQPTAAPDHPTVPLPLGYGVVAGPDVRAVDLDLLGPVWYSDGGAAGPDLPGHQRVRVLSPNDGRSDADVRILVRAHPGRWWILGSEPNRSGPGEQTPAAYAHYYARITAQIHAVDPSAGVLPAGLAAADIAWATAFRAAYTTQTGTPLQPDGWDIHDVLADGSDPYDFPTWRKRITSFRAWMDANGDGARPLVLGAFGALAGAGCCHQSLDIHDQAQTFMQSALDWLDGSGVVTAWAWTPFNAQGTDWNGGLLRPLVPGTLSPFGSRYRDHAAAFDRR
ncbi:MAG: glycoside hydrolase family protein [Chloroflexota bacterium]|nr:glycoside hydrolase family protein [Chloroflexota bacterium]